MLKKRLIFALLWRSGKFCLSRNFKLQAAGDLSWIERNYNFKVIASAIDELIVLNVSREPTQTGVFAEQISALTHDCFVPLAAGGNIRSVEDALLLLRSGADKLVLNSPLVSDPDLIASLVRRFGRQCVVASIDYRRTAAGTEVFIDNGGTATGLSVEQAIARAEALGAGEIFLTCVDRDGTGQGYDIDTLQAAAHASGVPVIASGGVGRFEHLADWLRMPVGVAAATANIFNFLGDGLREARSHLEGDGIPLAHWDYQWDPES